MRFATCNLTGLAFRPSLPIFGHVTVMHNSVTQQFGKRRTMRRRRMSISIKFTSEHFIIYLYRRLCGGIVVISRVDFEAAGSRVTSPESCDACPFRSTVATINLTIVKGRLIHATLLSIRYPPCRKRMDFYDFHLDHSQYTALFELCNMHFFHSV